MRRKDEVDSGRDGFSLVATTKKYFRKGNSEFQGSPVWLVLIQAALQTTEGRVATAVSIIHVPCETLRLQCNYY